MQCCCADGGTNRLSIVYRLCELLDSMMDIAPLRQNTLIVLAVSAELVPQLWYSAIKVWCFSLAVVEISDCYTEIRCLPQ